jgi:hypothetical protein
VGLLLPLREDFNDRSLNARSLSSQGVVMSTNTAKFGSQSAKFGSRSYLSFQGADLALGAEFLLETWVMQTARPCEYAPIFETLNNAPTYQGYSWDLQNGHLHFFDGNLRHNGTTVMPLNEWTFIQVMRRNSILSMWINGFPDYVGASTNIPSITGDFRIGSNNWSVTPVFWLDGYLQDLRLTKASRSPILPTQPFPTN